MGLYDVAHYEANLLLPPPSQLFPYKSTSRGILFHSNLPVIKFSDLITNTSYFNVVECPQDILFLYHMHYKIYKHCFLTEHFTMSVIMFLFDKH